MNQVCVFDKEKDIREVRPGLACDIAVAQETGAIIDASVTDEYNGFTDTDQIGTILRNVFDETDALRALAKQTGFVPKSDIGNDVQGDQTANE